MREILFRGKRISNGEWVEGGVMRAFHPNFDSTAQGFAMQEPNCYCICANYKDIFVEQNTIGQYTGLQDKNGKRIFEGDILKTHYANAKRSEFVEVVVFHNGRFCAEGNLGGGGRSWAPLWDGVRRVPQDKTIYMDSMEVIGNIHDNPDLLEVPHEN